VAYERYQNYYLQVKKSANTQFTREAERTLDQALNELEADLSL
jgi:hypothetical protein